MGAVPGLSLCGMRCCKPTIRAAWPRDAHVPEGHVCENVYVVHCARAVLAERRHRRDHVDDFFLVFFSLHCRSACSLHAPSLNLMVAHCGPGPLGATSALRANNGSNRRIRGHGAA